MVGLFFWGWCTFLFPSRVAALGLEQHLNLLNLPYATTSTTDPYPADRSWGMIQWDSNQFPDSTVYIEALIRCTNCVGGSARASASLYKANGDIVPGSTLTTTNTDYTLVRSAAITTNLADDTDYTVKMLVDATSGTAEIKSARLIVVQSASPITATQSQIDLASPTVSTNTVYELVSSPKLFRYDAENYAPTPTISFEATLASIGGSGTAYAVLSTSSNCLGTVNGSEISTTDASYNRIRSNPITLTDNTTYYACVKVVDSTTTSLANAKLIFNQSNGMGLSITEMSYQIINASVTDADDTYTSQAYPLQFTPANYSGAVFDYYYETTQKTTTDTAYSRLYNLSDSSAINNTELSTANTDYTRLRSGELSSHMPSSTKNLDTEIKNSATGTTTITSSRLIIIMTMYPELNFKVEGVPNNTLTNGVTTTNTTLPTSLTFGNIIPSDVQYLAHKLTTRTTAAFGYSVTVKFLNTLQGNYPANTIQEFPYSWDNPHDWSSPNGSTPNVNTGWFGANTSDTRVPNWSNATGKFGAISTTSCKVMQATGMDSGTSAYVTYALEANSHQPTDTYAGTLVYNVTAVY